MYSDAKENQLCCGCFNFDIKILLSFLYNFLLAYSQSTQYRIYGVHDEAKDKAFELELSWVCDESNRQHQKVLGCPPENGHCSSFCVNLQLNLFAHLSYRYQMICWSRPRLLLRRLWRKWMLTKKHRQYVRTYFIFWCCWNLWSLWGDILNMANLSVSLSVMWTSYVLNGTSEWYQSSGDYFLLDERHSRSPGIFH